MLRASSRCLAVVAAIGFGAHVQSIAETGPMFRHGQDVALRDTEKARTHASPAGQPASPQDAAMTHGTYVTILHVPDLKLPGYLRVHLTDTTFTGRMFLGGRRFALMGDLGTEIKLQATFNDSTGAEVAYDISLTLDMAANNVGLSGTLALTETADPTQTSSTDLHLRPRLFASGNAGAYTLSLPPDLAGAPNPTGVRQHPVSSLTPPGPRPAALGGSGYGLLRVSSHGAVRATAALADGRRIALGGYLDVSGNAAVFSQLYADAKHPADDPRDIHGFIGGVFRFRDRPHLSDAVAVLRWVRPTAFDRPDDTFHGFSVVQPAVATRFEPFDERLSVLDGVHAGERPVVVTLTEGGLPDTIVTEGIVDRDYVKCDHPDFHAEFSSGFGLFHGHFHHPGPHADVNINGVLLQKQGRAVGQFFDQFGHSGSVTIDQKPKATPAPAATPAPSS